MNTLVKVLVAAGVVAVVAVIVVQSMRGAELAAWESWAQARAAGGEPPALEDALAEASGTDAEPFLRFALARAYYEQGEPEDLERAVQVAEAGLAGNPDPPVSDWLRNVADAARSLQR